MTSQKDDVLQMKDISKSFSGVEVLKSVSLSVSKGKILGLVGQNGAGKSTLMNIVGGVLPADKGKMCLMGNEFKPLNPFVAEKMGIAFIHQELNLFPNLSIAENMFIDSFPLKGPLHTVNFKAARRAAKEALGFLGVSISPDKKVQELSMGQRQMVEIAKYINRNAIVIIFDEPTTSLSHKEKEMLFRVIRGLRDKGAAIIYISHILEDIFELCDRAAVLRDGRVIKEASIGEFDSTAMIKMMVGRDLKQIFPTVDKKIGELAFEAREIQANGVHGISLSLHEGEIVGMFGLMGAGRTEFAKAIFGVEKMESGGIFYKGEQINPITPRNCIRHGIAFITEDRRYEGLLMPKTVKENLLCAFWDKLTSGPWKWINVKQEDECAAKQIKDLQIKTADSKTQPVRNLSGGNQQKVVLGKWLMLEPGVILLDEPTKGVDVGAKFEIYSIINQIAKNGSSVLLISSEMEELIGICDRIIIIHDGLVKGEFHKETYDSEAILKVAVEGSV